MPHVVVPYGSNNATVRARALQWIDRCSATVDPVVVHGPGFDSAPVSTGAPVLLLRNATKFTRGGREERLLRGASPGVYDLDDGLPWDHGNLPGLGHWWKRPFPRSIVAARAAAAADRVICGNSTLADWASERCDDVRVVPTCVEPAEYDRRSDWSIGERPPVLGWIGSSATNLYMADIADALRQVQRTTGARIVMVTGGALLPAPLRELVEAEVWSSASTRRVAGWDIGLMPLRDGVYERAKCGYKLLQYAASGIPAIGSPVGVNASLLAQMDGLAPTTTDEWVDALLAIIGESSERRRDRARRGFEVASQFSFDHWEERWIDAVGWRRV